MTGMIFKPMSPEANHTINFSLMSKSLSVEPTKKKKKSYMVKISWRVGGFHPNYQIKLSFLR